MEKNTISMAIFNSYFDITRGYSIIHGPIPWIFWALTVSIHEDQGLVQRIIHGHGPCMSLYPVAAT